MPGKDKSYITQLRQEAEHGHPGSQMSLGLAFWVGEGVEADLQTAYAWLWCADQNDFPMAKNPLRVVAKELGVRELHEAQEKARELHRFYKR